MKITSLAKEPPSSLVGSESADDGSSDSSLYDHHLLDVLHLSSEVCLEESKAAAALSSLFNRFGLVLLRAFLIECNGVEDLPLNAMVGKSCFFFVLLTALNL